MFIVGAKSKEGRHLPLPALYHMRQVGTAALVKRHFFLYPACHHG